MLFASNVQHSHTLHPMPSYCHSTLLLFFTFSRANEIKFYLVLWERGMLHSGYAERIFYSMLFKNLFDTPALLSMRPCALVKGIEKNTDEYRGEKNEKMGKEHMLVPESTRSASLLKCLDIAKKLQQKKRVKMTSHFTPSKLKGQWSKFLNRCSVEQLIYLSIFK